MNAVDVYSHTAGVQKGAASTAVAWHTTPLNGQQEANIVCRQTCFPKMYTTDAIHKLAIRINDIPNYKQ